MQTGLTNNQNHRIALLKGAKHNREEEELKAQLRQFDSRMSRRKSNQSAYNITVLSKRNYRNKFIKSQSNLDPSALRVTQSQDQAMQLDQYMHGRQFNAQHLGNYMKHCKYSSMCLNKDGLDSDIKTLQDNSLNLPTHNDHSFLNDPSTLPLKGERDNLLAQLDKSNESISKQDPKELSYYFRTQNHRGDLSSQLKFQRYPSEYDKQNPLIAFPLQQEPSCLQKQQEALQKKGFYDSYKTVQPPCDGTLLQFSKGYGNQKHDYEQVKENRNKYQQWRSQQTETLRRIRYINNRCANGVLGVDDPAQSNTILLKSINEKNKALAQQAQLQQQRHQAQLQQHWQTSKELKFESIQSQGTEPNEEHEKRKEKGGDSFIRIFQSNLDKRRLARGCVQPKEQLGRLY